MSKDYLQNINQVLQKMGKDAVELGDDFDKQGLLDSIETVDFFVSLEKEFGLKISDDEIYDKKLTNVSNLIFYLKSKSS